MSVSCAILASRFRKDHAPVDLRVPTRPLLGFSLTGKHARVGDWTVPKVGHS
jgi:hypothetical protein